MKLPSWGQALGDARSTFLRFPVVMIDAAVGTAAAIVLIDYEGPAGPTILFRILLSTILGIPLLCALVLLAEKRGLKASLSRGLQGLGVLSLALYAFTVPLDLASAPAYTMLRFLLLASALHLLVAVIPFERRGELNGFWHYNESLFLRLLAALLYTAILFAGLAIALASLKELFGVDIPSKRYAELWVCMGGLFLTWFFLAGVPKNLSLLESLEQYPKWLKIFAQYIIMPLVVIYLVILYAYMAKILIAWDWPQGYVSKLIFGFSGSGIFSLLLLYPLSARGENKWITLLARWFYRILLPLLVMLFLAVWRRVSQYGLTSGRYIALGLALWLVLLVVYNLLSRTKSIKFIPASLCILALAVSFGPWGMLAMSERSQIARLRSVSERNGILLDGRVSQQHGEVSFADQTEIRSILQYLHDIHGYDGIQAWFQEPLKESQGGAASTYKEFPAVARLMGIGEGPTREGTGVQTFNLVAHDSDVIDLRGYDRMVRRSQFGSAQDSSIGRREGIVYRFRGGKDTMVVAPSASGEEGDTLVFDLAAHARRLISRFGSSIIVYVPQEEFALKGENSHLKVKVCFLSIGVTIHSDTARPFEVKADILYTLKK